MRWRLDLGLASMAMVLVTLVGCAEASDSRVEPPADTSATTTSTTAKSEPSPPAPPTTVGSSLESGTMWFWSVGALPDQLLDALARSPAVTATTVVAGAELGLISSTDLSGRIVDQTTDGWRIPIDAMAIDPAGYASFVSGPDAQSLAQLGPNEAVLTETSARLRRVGVGGVLRFLEGPELVVSGVVADRPGAGAEMLIDRRTGAELGIDKERFVLVEGSGDGAEEELERLASEDPPVRFRGSGERPFARHGDAVSPLMLIKQRFGEFAFRPSSGRMIVMPEEWVSANVATAEVPILGEIRCHRQFLLLVDAAMERLVDRGLAHLVDPGGFAGCWSPRRQGTTGPLSRHAWGAAIDLNIGANPRGDFATQDERLVEIFASLGVGWGGTWLHPDPGHYEWLHDQA